MRKILSAIAILFAIAPILAAKQPSWIKNRPVSSDYYIGIGSVPAHTPDHILKAKEKALADLISEIAVTIENKSLLERLEKDDTYTESYENDIRAKSKAWIEGYELVDSYNDGTDYWVFYRLDRKEYAGLKKKKSDEASGLALDLWKNGNNALISGNFIAACRFYADGIKAIEPFADMRLEVENEGTTMNIAAELQYSLSAMFSQFRILPTPARLTLAPFNAGASELLIKVSSGSHDLAGVSLDAAMDSGSARIDVRSATDNTGHSRISISDVSARPMQRILTITPGIDFGDIFESPVLKSIASGLTGMMQPIKIPVTIADSGLKAFFVASDPKSTQLTKQIAAYINNSYFDIVDNETDANLKFEVRSSFREGDTMSGEMYDMREYYSSASVTVTDLSSGTAIATASVNDLRTIAPAKSAKAKAYGNAQRQVFKKIQTVLDRQLISAKLKRRADDRQLSTATEEAAFCNEEYE